MRQKHRIDMRHVVFLFISVAISNEKNTDVCNGMGCKDSTGAGPYWVDGIGYGQSSFTRDIVQDDEIYHHYCRSKNNQNCDMIFEIHTDGGPMYQYNYETKEIKAAGWPM